MWYVFGICLVFVYLGSRPSDLIQDMSSDLTVFGLHSREAEQYLSSMFY